MGKAFPVFQTGRVSSFPRIYMCKKNARAGPEEKTYRYSVIGSWLAWRVATSNRAGLVGQSREVLAGKPGRCVYELVGCNHYWEQGGDLAHRPVTTSVSGSSHHGQKKGLTETPPPMHNAAAHTGCYAAPMPPILLYVDQWHWFHSFILQSALQQVHSLFQSNFSAPCDPVFPVSISSIILFP